VTDRKKVLLQWEDRRQFLDCSSSDADGEVPPLRLLCYSADSYAESDVAEAASGGGSSNSMADFDDNCPSSPCLSTARFFAPAGSLTRLSSATKMRDGADRSRVIWCT
jgi:hypothetical protein